MESISNFIKNNKAFSITIGIIGSIFIGALGSGLWEYLLKPLLSFSLNSILDLSTLGIEAFKNSVYLSISQGFTEKNSLVTFVYISSLCLGFIIVLIFILFKLYRRKLNKSRKKFNSKIDFLTLYILGFTSFILVFIQNSQLIYINNSITHYKQLISISTPYISEYELKILNSRFSLIKNKNDYERLITDLYIILEKNNLELKRMNIW